MSQEQPGLSRRALLGLFRRPRTTEAHVVEPSARVPKATVATSPGAFSAPVAEPSARVLRGPVVEPRGASSAPGAARSGGSSSASAPPHASSLPGTFSLETFYANRARSGEATLDGRIPLFSLREGLVVPQTEGTSVHEAARVGGPSEATSMPPGTDGTLAGQVRAPVSTPVLGATVRVRTQLCLAWQGSFCTTCVERCPVEGAIVVESGRPRVVPERCDGCGTCVRVCPAPLNAFELRPAEAPGATS